MKPVDQTKFGSPDGNCFAACVATIFELPLEAVPHFMNEGNWYAAFRNWSHEKLKMDTLCLVGVKATDEWLNELKAPVIVSGPANRGHDHATVWVEGKMVHDPHPSRDGINSVIDVIVFIPLAPERV